MEENTTQKKRMNSYSILIGFILIIIATVLMLCFFLHGETKVTGEWAGVEKSETMVCNKSDKVYPFLTYDESKNKATRINVVFDGDKIGAMSLTHTLYYNDYKTIIDSENLNHIAMNDAFDRDGLGFDALGLKFSKFTEGLQMSLYDDEISAVTAKYFLLDGISTYDMNSMRQSYEEAGFECKINNQ